MKINLLSIAASHNNPIARQRARRLLRLRYGIVVPSSRPQRDPYWLSAYSI